MSGSDRIVVIGAGIVGVSTALRLARAGAAVTLIDKDGPAGGASYGNAGVIAAGSVTPVAMPGLALKAPRMLFDPDQPLFLRWRDLPRLAPYLLRFLANANTKDAERISAGMATLLSDAADQHLSLSEGTDAARFVHEGDYLFGYKDYAAYRADAASWGMKARRGVETEELDAAALAEYDPALEGRFGFGVRTTRQGMISDPGAYVGSLAKAFEAAGGAMMRATVRDIPLSGGRAVGVETEQGRIPAAHVVLTMGAWSGALAQRLGVKVRLASERGYHLEFYAPSLTFRSPTMPAKGKFVLTSMEGRLRAAGVAEFAAGEAPPSEAPFRLLHKQVKALLPDLRYERVERWMGRRPSTADSLPVIGRAPKAENVWLGYGHQHVGLTGGPKTGLWLSQMILGRPPNEDVRPFDPARDG